MQDAFSALHVLITGEKVCLQCCSKLVVTKCRVTETVRQRVQGHHRMTTLNIPQLNTKQWKYLLSVLNSANL